MSYPGELQVLRATEWALRSELASPPAQVVPQGPLKVVWLQQAEMLAAHPDVPVLPQAGAELVSVRAGLPPEEEAAVSVHAAAEPRPEAASVPWVQQAAAGAAEELDEPRAARAAEVAASVVPAQQPAEVQRADVAGQLPAALRRADAEPQAAARLAGPDVRRAVVPSEAASVFRQGPILAGPARPRAAARFAHAMRSLQLALRSEPSWQAARNEGWSCGSTSPEGSLTKSGVTKGWFSKVLE
ncbi:hypothetical protein QWJ07_25845 [Frankia sp. RB7]|nr:hypothetical protein [Frankia sp. RB7]